MRPNYKKRKSTNYIFVGKEEDNNRIKTALVLEREFWAISMYVRNNRLGNSSFFNCISRMNDILYCYQWTISRNENCKLLKDKELDMIQEIAHLEDKIQVKRN